MTQLGNVKTSRWSESRRALDCDLTQNSAQLVEVHRFRKVEVEARLLTALYIISRAKAG